MNQNKEPIDTKPWASLPSTPMTKVLEEEIAKEAEANGQLSSSPPVYTDEEKAAFLKQLEQYAKKNPMLAQGQKKFRSKMSNFTPKKKKRK